jgi:hypothetical protein
MNKNKLPMMAALILAPTLVLGGSIPYATAQENQDMDAPVTQPTQQAPGTSTSTVEIATPQGTVITHEIEVGHVVLHTGLSGEEEVHQVNTNATGHFFIGYDPSNPEWAYFELRIWNGQAITEAHLHCAPEGENGPVITYLFGEIPGGFDINGDVLARFTLLDRNILEDTDCESTIGYNIQTFPELIQAMEQGDIYVNVHNVEYPQGLLRGQLERGDQTGIEPQFQQQQIQQMIVPQDQTMTGPETTDTIEYADSVGENSPQNLTARLSNALSDLHDALSRLFIQINKS